MTETNTFGYESETHNTFVTHNEIEIATCGLCGSERERHRTAKARIGSRVERICGGCQRRSIMDESLPGECPQCDGHVPGSIDLEFFVDGTHFERRLCARHTRGN